MEFEIAVYEGQAGSNAEAEHAAEDVQKLSVDDDAEQTVLNGDRFDRLTDQRNDVVFVLHGNVDVVARAGGVEGGVSDMDGRVMRYADGVVQVDDGHIHAGKSVGDTHVLDGELRHGARQDLGQRHLPVQLFDQVEFGRDLRIDVQRIFAAVVIQAQERRVRVNGLTVVVQERKVEDQRAGAHIGQCDAQFDLIPYIHLTALLYLERGQKVLRKEGHQRVEVDGGIGRRAELKRAGDGRHVFQRLMQVEVGHSLRLRVGDRLQLFVQTDVFHLERRHLEVQKAGIVRPVRIARSDTRGQARPLGDLRAQFDGIERIGEIDGQSDFLNADIARHVRHEQSQKFFDAGVIEGDLEHSVRLGGKFQILIAGIVVVTGDQKFDQAHYVHTALFHDLFVRRGVQRSRKRQFL